MDGGMMLQNYFVLSFKWRNLMEDFAIIGFIFGWRLLRK